MKYDIAAKRIVDIGKEPAESNKMKNNREPETENDQSQYTWIYAQHFLHPA